MLSGFVEFDGYYLESDPCLVCNNPEVPFQVWLSLFIEILCSPSSVVFRDFTQHLQEKGFEGEYRIVTENINVKPHEKCVHYIGTYLVITLSRTFFQVSLLSAILTDKIIYFTHNKTIGLRRNICVHTVGSLNTRESREFHLLCNSKTRIRVCRVLSYKLVSFINLAHFINFYFTVTSV